MTVDTIGSSPATLPQLRLPLPPEDPRWGELEFMFYGPADNPFYTWYTRKARRLRRAATQLSPLAFMLVYMTESLVPLQTPYGPVYSFSEFHLAMCEEAKHWIYPRGRRMGIIAPRGAGKSKLLYEVLPLWALAHGHRKFFLGYADTDTQAVDQLNKLRDHLKTNDLLLYDYPELWPYRGGRNNKRVIETRPDLEGMLEWGFKRSEALEIAQGGGRICMTAGVDKATLGASEKVGRPDLITIDDGEPTASGYARRGGTDNKDMRLETIRDVILQMNPLAAVLLSGTVVMPGAIADDLVKAALGEPTEDWVRQEKFNVAYFNAIQDEDTPWERSLWPEKWSIEELRYERQNNPEKYALHKANRPLTRGGKYWQDYDIQYGCPFPIDHYVMYVDPAEVAEEGRDKTAWVVVGFDRPHGRADRAVVLWTEQGHFDDVELGNRIVEFKRDNPRIHVLNVFVEGFNSGRLRYNTLLPILQRDRGIVLEMDRPKPVVGESRRPDGKLETGKPARIQRAFPHYRSKRVWHRRKFATLEAMLTSYPKTGKAGDDLIDALAGALRMGFGD